MAVDSLRLMAVAIRPARRPLSATPLPPSLCTPQALGTDADAGKSRLLLASHSCGEVPKRRAPYHPRQ